MLSKLTLELTGEKLTEKNYRISSLTQGILMEHIPPEYGEKMHIQQIHPYSQSVFDKEGKCFWSIRTMNGEARRNILDYFICEEVDSIFVKHRNLSYRIVERSYEELTYEGLLEKYYFNEEKKQMHIRFITPTSFKKDGYYSIFPTVRLIFQNLMLRYDSCANDTTCFDTDILKHYEKYAHITQYKLKSTFFPIEGVRIPAFIGEISIKIAGPQQLINLAWMLAKFGTFSGVGIKTAMGMGMIEIN